MMTNRLIRNKTHHTNQCLFKTGASRGNIHDLDIDHIQFGIKAASPHQVFQHLAVAASHETGLDPVAILEELTRQENINASAAGQGVAIPQARIAGLKNPFVTLATLARAVDFDACDHKPVDIITLILSPAQDGPLHLQRLSAAARILRDEQLLGNIRDARSEDNLKALLSGQQLYKTGSLAA